MKQFLCSAASLLLALQMNAQQVPTASGGGSNSNFWARGGNTQSNGNNIFGTQWNSPIYFITAGLTQQTYRMKLNGDFAGLGQYPVNGFTSFNGVNTSGYLGLGYNLAGIWSQNPSPNGAAKGPFSLLHLNGRDGNFVQEGGYRPWMKTGISFTDNQDFSYFGLRTILPDLTETVLSWSEVQSNAIPPGQDDMTFRFIAGSGSTLSPNLSDVNDLDGLHIARFTGFGHFALGNTFGTTQGGSPYVRPASHLHISHNQYIPTNKGMGFLQITYRDLTAETQDDGLRLGIDRLNGITNAYLRWQEKSAFIVQTDWNDAPGGIQDGERLRVTSTNALNVPDPADTLNGNITRVAISHRGDQPVTSPRSLLHLGYNTGANTPLNTTDGWRDWMDIGTFTGNGTDHMYIGLKDEGDDRLDAVVNWGDNQTPGVNPNGPDNLRFVFTSTTTAASGQGDSISQSYHGLEIARMYPDFDESFTYGGNFDGYGRMGIGDFTTAGVNEAPTHKLDVIGNGRFRYLPDSLYIADSTVYKYVMVDSMGVLRWTTNSPSGFGAACGDSINGRLQYDTKVDLNNYNLYFERNDVVGKNRLGLGYNCSDSLRAKLNVFNINEEWNSDFVMDNSNPVNLNFQGGTSSSIINTRSTNATAVYGQVEPNLTGAMTTQIGVHGYVKGEIVKEAIGVKGDATVSNPSSASIGGKFSSEGSGAGRGIISSVIVSQQSPGALSGFGFGADSYAQGNQVNGAYGVRGGSFCTSCVTSVGGTFQATGTSQTHIGIVASATGGVNNFAARFIGDVTVIGNIVASGSITPSDELFKTNVADLTNSMDLINQLSPKTYDYDNASYPDFNFESDQQMGLIAQEVELVIPAIVSEHIRPAEYDSIGNIVVPELTFKGVEYEELIPLLIGGLKEQQVEIASKDSIINDLNNRLTSLENCLSGILPFLCQMSNTAIEQTHQEMQNELINTINVQLSNKNNIVLNQNVPNPFAESTVITYSIPESVAKAQIHFYDGMGKLINSVDVTERGAGRMNVYGNDLSSGVYTYSLVADGQVVSTKRMVKE